jgi:hypothetical protein
MGSGRTMKRGARRVFASRRRICICILHWEVGQAGARNGLHYLCFSGLEICRVSSVWLVDRLFTLTSVFSSAGLALLGPQRHCALAAMEGANMGLPHARLSVDSCHHRYTEDWRLVSASGPWGVQHQLSRDRARSTRYPCLGSRRRPPLPRLSRLPRCTRTFESL